MWIMSNIIEIFLTIPFELFADVTSDFLLFNQSILQKFYKQYIVEEKRAAAGYTRMLWTSHRCMLNV